MMLTAVGVDFRATRLPATVVYNNHNISGVSVATIIIWVSKCLERNIVLGYTRRFKDLPRV